MKKFTMTLASVTLALTLTTGSLWMLATFTDIPSVVYAACNGQCCDGKSSCSSDIQGCYCTCTCDSCSCFPHPQQGGGSGGSSSGGGGILDLFIEIIRAIAEIFR